MLSSLFRGRTSTNLYQIKKKLFSQNLNYDKYPFLKTLGISKDNLGGFNGKEWVAGNQSTMSINPADNIATASVKLSSKEDYEQCIKSMQDMREKWMGLNMISRGLIVQEIGEEMKKKKDALGKLVSLEMGKIYSEGLGEIQEVIDICDYAVGLSRTINGRIFSSERQGHMLYENWNPMGLMGCITAFNFPAAVLGWNAALAMVCGNLTLWKGSPTTCLVSIAMTRIIVDVLEKHGYGGVFTMVSETGKDLSEKMINDNRLPLISFTGSCEIGSIVSRQVNARFGRTILELGGNNALIVMDDADCDMALKSAVFNAIGTGGQRCTSLRRLMLHEKVYDNFLKKLTKVYETVKMGDQFDSQTLLCPLHSKKSIQIYQDGLKEIQKQGGKIVYGGKVIEGTTGNYVQPTIVEISPNAEITKTELFVPILYVMKIKSFEEAVKINNDVPQGLSSSLFTKDMQKVFKWMGPNGSDCGLVNVNSGTSGAEIGGAFGGNKATGWGRESGGDAWKQYMRVSTCTINYEDKIALSQGVKFDI